MTLPPLPSAFGIRPPAWPPPSSGILVWLQVDYPLLGPPHLSPSDLTPPSLLFSLPASYPLSDPEAEHGGGKLHGDDRMMAGTPSRRPPACKEANREGIGDLGFERCGNYRFVGGWRGGCGGDGIPHDGGD